MISILISSVLSNVLGVPVCGTAPVSATGINWPLPVISYANLRSSAISSTSIGTTSSLEDGIFSRSQVGRQYSVDKLVPLRVRHLFVLAELGLVPYICQSTEKENGPQRKGVIYTNLRVEAAFMEAVVQ